MAEAEEDAEKANFSSILISAEESIDKFQSSVKSAADAYEKLLTGNYSSTDLLDSIQAINKAASEMGKSIDWEEIGSLDDLSKFTNTEIRADIIL